MVVRPTSRLPPLLRTALRRYDDNTPRAGPLASARHGGSLRLGLARPVADGVRGSRLRDARRVARDVRGVRARRRDRRGVRRAALAPGRLETASANASDAGGASDASGLNVGYALAGLAALGTALLLAFVVAEYQKIAALFELVERCASDPAALREVVAEQVHSRATATAASDGKTHPNTRPEHPSAAPNTNWETLAFAGPVATLLGAAPPSVVRAVEGNAAAAAAGYGAVADSAAAIDAAASIDIPEDPDAAIREYVTAALVKVPDEIMRVVFRNAVAGPAWCAIAGAVLLVASAAESAEGGVSGLLVTLGVILLVFGFLGVVAASLAYVSVRTLVLAALEALVADTTDRMAPATGVGAGVAKMAKDVGRSVADSVESAKSVVAESVGEASERADEGRRRRDRGGDRRRARRRWRRARARWGRRRANARRRRRRRRASARARSSPRPRRTCSAAAAAESRRREKGRRRKPVTERGGEGARGGRFVRGARAKDRSRRANAIE